MRTKAVELAERAIAPTCWDLHRIRREMERLLLNAPIEDHAEIVLAAFRKIQDEITTPMREALNAAYEQVLAG